MKKRKITITQAILILNAFNALSDALDNNALREIDVTRFLKERKKSIEQKEENKK